VTISSSLKSSTGMSISDGPVVNPSASVGSTPPAGVSTPVVAVEYDNWPPGNPAPDTLYLRLAPP
jgi:hypothetical protein